MQLPITAFAVEELHRAKSRTLPLGLFGLFLQIFINLAKSDANLPKLSRLRFLSLLQSADHKSTFYLRCLTQNIQETTTMIVRSRVVDCVVSLLPILCHSFAREFVDRELHDQILDLHRNLLSAAQLDALHAHLRQRRVEEKVPQRELSMGHGYGGDSGSGGDMMNGGGGGGMNGDAHAVIMSLLSSVDLIERKVYPLYATGNPNGSDIVVGVETFTTSDDETVASNLKLHVSQMESLLSNNGRIRRFDPLFASFEDHFDQIRSLKEPLDNGVHVLHAGETKCAAALVKAHSLAVSAFVEGGPFEVMQTHVVPDACESDNGPEPSGFSTFSDSYPGNILDDDNRTEFDDAAWHDGGNSDGEWDLPCELISNITWYFWNRSECAMMLWHRNFSHSWNRSCDERDESCTDPWMHGDSSCDFGNEDCWGWMYKNFSCEDGEGCHMLWICKNGTNGSGWGHAYDRHGHDHPMHLCLGGNCSRCNITSSPSSGSTDLETNKLEGSSGTTFTAGASLMLAFLCLIIGTFASIQA